MHAGLNTLIVTISERVTFTHEGQRRATVHVHHAGVKVQTLLVNAKGT